jgi:hypothetical protein
MDKSLIILTLITSSISGCATNRTKYAPMTDTGGYADKKVDDNLFVSRFSGNAYTHRNDASLFSMLRAVEICQDNGYIFARIYGSKDNSTSRTVLRTANYSFQQPTYFNGSANTYGNYNYLGGGYGQLNSNTNLYGTVTGGNTYGGSKTWEETYNYPTFDTLFSCTNQPFFAGVQLKNISADDMKPFVKDLMGAMQVEKVTRGSPNEGIIQTGDLITRVNGNRIKSLSEFVGSIDTAKNKNKITIVVIRDGKQIILNAKATDGTLTLKLQTVEIVSAACNVPEIKKRPVCIGRLPASK